MKKKKKTVPKRNPYVSIVMKKKTRKHKNRRREDQIKWNDYKESY